MVKNASDKHKHHHKPYRMHHITLAGFSLFAFLICATYLTIFYVYSPTQPPLEQMAQVRGATTSERVTVRSSLGFALDIDTGMFDAAAYEAADDDEDIPLQALTEQRGDTAITAVTLTPQAGAVEPYAQASQLSLLHETASELPTLLAEFADEELYELVETGEEPIGPLNAEKRVYQYRGSDVYSVVWSPLADEPSEYTIIVRGLIGTPELPGAYAELLGSIRLGETLALQFFQSGGDNWVSGSESTRQYLSDLLSPAVVKLYHIVCAEIAFEFQAAIEQQCRATTGSGFFISSNGYIATNGHVVVYEPEDALVDALLSNPMQLSSYLGDVIGLSTLEIATLQHRPEKLASVVSQIYSLPDDSVSFTAESKVILAAIGNTPILPETEEEVLDLLDFRSTRDIKTADLVYYDYSGKDQINIVSQDAAGFSQSDVALLHIRMENTPIISLAAPADATPGQAITILGFPSDAENELVDQTELAVSTTNGTISSIRTAAGGTGTLLQTDADASQGNSGGPAVLTSNAKAVGLLTYRYKDETKQNAAKSYLRDITDIRSLLDTHGITLDVNSITQQAWSNGLEYFANQRFQRAIQEFEKVQDAFPAHRLVERYIAASEQNIADGNERTSPAAQYLGLGGSIGLLAISSQLIRRHHRHHRSYKENQATHTEHKPDTLPPNDGSV